jgi:hypothetical protein
MAGSQIATGAPLPWLLALESLSRMMGNYQVRFLGDEGGAIGLSYLTKYETLSIKIDSYEKFVIDNFSHDFHWCIFPNR